MEPSFTTDLRESAITDVADAIHDERYAVGWWDIDYGPELTQVATTIVDVLIQNGYLR